MAGALLDTHALYWAVSGESRLSSQAVTVFGQSQTDGRLFISPISAWEMSLAAQKRVNALNFGNLSLEEWFSRARKQILFRPLPITQRIAIEAATVAKDTGHRDPADCYMIATARVRKIPVITRDAVILKIAASGYVSAIAC
ncbi:type II toxin-antitoxin system VapC family toxin [Neorhizobium sp. JUb45]|uniref:type II toxin-antitoxin system VapC family toxin n=1 Tax=Neorhizobium sp. JUb45 TaxID=2485113 RepID=UPI00104BDA36|nr:PIN domain nuclease of toxin-antitoxin system [Neorhizobium sp. JUb45]